MKQLFTSSENNVVLNSVVDSQLPEDLQVHHQALVSAGNLALFCNYKATLSKQNVIYVVFNGLRRSRFIVDSWGSIRIFISAQS